MISRRQTRRLLALANVVSVGTGRKNGIGHRCVVVGVTEKLPLAELDAADVVPRRVGRQDTDVVEVGELKAQRDPVGGGVSIGHPQITAGTLGCRVEVDRLGLALSNNHVLAASNEGQVGDPILQPGTHDGGVLPDDEFGELVRFVPLVFEGDPLGCLAQLFPWKRRQAVNHVDAALCRPLRPEWLVDEILGIGVPQGKFTGQLELGAALMKSGRTTGVTHGVVRQVEATVRVNYGDNRFATFEDQVIASDMSAPGDSGSAVLNADQLLAGLLFAGSDTVTIFSPWYRVRDALGLD